MEHYFQEGHVMVMYKRKEEEIQKIRDARTDKTLESEKNADAPSLVVQARNWLCELEERE
jgi:hypothetical protein